MDIEDYEEYIHKKRPNLRKTSVESYAILLRRLTESLKKDSDIDFDYLKRHAEVEKYLEKYKPNTRKNILNAIIVAIHDEPKVRKRYDELRDKYNKQYETEHEDNIKNKKQSESWVEWDKFQKMIKYFSKEVKRLHLRTTTRELSINERRLLGDYVLIRLYEELPVRNDYHNVRVVRGNEHNKDKSQNYLLIKGHSMSLVLNYYKTSRKYGQKVIELSNSLSALLKDYFKQTQRKWLIVNERTDDPMGSKDITRRLNRITKDRLGKAIGSNQIRHSYLSHKYADTVEEMKEDSNKMGHSLETQKKYIKS